MSRFAVFYRTKEKKDVYWFCVAENKEEARQEFVRDYKETINLKMDEVGFAVVQIPDDDFLLQAKVKGILIDEKIEKEKI